jgi:RNA polymerase sporulation-specific sigma factor
MDKNELVNIVLNNEKLIYSIVNKIKGYYDKNDLYQVGVIGLIKAYRNYNDSYNTKFSTYAFSYILGEIKKYIREDRGIKISRDLFKLSNKIDQAREVLAQRLMHEPTLKELSLFLEIDEQQISEALGIHEYIQSLDVPLNEDGKELTLYDNIQQEERIEMIDKINLDDGISNLSLEDQKLIYMRYLDDKTQQEIADTLGLTQVQVSRQEQKVLTKLRSNLI